MTPGRGETPHDPPPGHEPYPGDQTHPNPPHTPHNANHKEPTMTEPTPTELQLAQALLADLGDIDAARIIGASGRLVDALGLAGIAETRGLDVVLAELADDIAAQHDADEVDLPPAAELLEVIEDRPALALVPAGPPWPTDHYRVDLDRGRLRAEVYADHAGEHRWRVVHTTNGETMASGEGYADTRDRDHAVALLFPGVDRVVIDAPEVTDARSELKVGPFMSPTELAELRAHAGEVID